ncbi:hypothetical protein [Streptomyces sp. NPDC001340]
MTYAPGCTAPPATATETVRALAAAGAEVTVATRRPELAEALVREP